MVHFHGTPAQDDRPRTMSDMTLAICMHGTSGCSFVLLYTVCMGAACMQWHGCFFCLFIICCLQSDSLHQRLCVLVRTVLRYLMRREQHACGGAKTASCLQRYMCTFSHGTAMSSSASVTPSSAHFGVHLFSQRLK